MVLKSREELVKRLMDYVGNDGSDDDIAFVEDIVDTYNEAITRAEQNDTEVWKAKYDELDKKWKTKYFNRFGKGTVSAYYEKEEVVDEDKGNEDIDGEEITFDDLYEEKKGGN